MHSSTTERFLVFLDYLLSNNHVNSLIVLKLDFSDEEVLAYYISFLKTLSFKLNTHTIHFFYNEVIVLWVSTCALCGWLTDDVIQHVHLCFIAHSI